MNLKNHLQTLALPLHQNFVDPILCKDLFEAGLTDKTPFFWKISNGQPFIWTTTFDPDKYYTNAEAIIDACLHTAILPAYTAADMEKIIGNFLHTCVAGNHEVTPLQHRRIGLRMAPRYPDALAMIATELLMRRIIAPAAVNNIIQF